MPEVYKKKIRSRIILKKGAKNFALKPEHIVFFYAEGNLVFGLDKDNNKYSCNENLTELQSLLDETFFFRANRQYLINLNYIQTYQSHERVKLLVEIAVGKNIYNVILSQVTAPLFKKWIMEV